MLSRSHRFHGLGSLRGVYQHGRSVRGGQLGLKYALRKPDKPYRVAVVVSRKVHKSAVIRNRIRRRIYEQVRLNENLIKPSTDLVFTAYHPSLAKIETTKLADLIKDLLKKTT